jgi:tetratricopeptide (TPR) repeat protein
VESDLLASRAIPRLGELRLQAVETRIDADLHLGRHREVIGELRHLAAAHPLRERLRGLLMLALYRDGRQAEALAAYARARRILVDELGTEPGAGLRELHQQMLNGDPALDFPLQAPGAATSAAPSVPRQLPAAISGLTGRTAELAALTRMLDQAVAEGPGTVVISAIGGTAGVGKTALALHWAHQVAGRFAGGQLYVNLRGFDPSGVPVAAGEAVRGFLDALGVAPDRIPAQLEARAGLYRSLLAERAMLIVLDNARDEQQVRPLLPASPASLVIVTSRSQLGGLAAADSARLLSLDVLSQDEAVDMLTARVGASRAGAEPAAVGEIAALCGRLPLALAVAAARAEARPDFPLAAVAAELKDRARRLDALDAGDPGSSVRAVFSWSYRQLSDAAARMFRLLGLHPGPDSSPPAAASLAAVDEPGARRLAGRTHPRAPGRRACPGPVCAARPAARLRRRSGPLCRQPARARRRGRPGAGPLPAHRPRRRRHGALVSSPDPAGPVEPGYRPRALHRAQAGAGLVRGRIPRPARRHDPRRGLRAALAAIAEYQGHYAEALSHAEQAASLFRDIGDKIGEADLLSAAGWHHALLGDYPQARRLCRQALALNDVADYGSRHLEGNICNSLGYTEYRAGDLAEAAACYDRALSIFRTVGDRWGQADTLTNLGDIRRAVGELLAAREAWQQALVILDDLQHPDAAKIRAKLASTDELS